MENKKEGKKCKRLNYSIKKSIVVECKQCDEKQINQKHLVNMNKAIKKKQVIIFADLFKNSKRNRYI